MSCFVCTKTVHPRERQTRAVMTEAGGNPARPRVWFPIHSPECHDLMLELIAERGQGITRGELIEEARLRGYVRDRSAG